MFVSVPETLLVLRISLMCHALQRFYSVVLLEKCRDDIRANNKLNYHLYMALKKALFKVRTSEPNRVRRHWCRVANSLAPSTRAF